ncbi:type II toxin-antitoxin system RelE/ParE family toxin [Ruegeria sp.]|uniref:type II toxin-antitoxin system RelE/ParE family toxin n=1 Tax=Ruegeria sp. TaxID=1879320 RepID=UPI0023132BB9|nr:type II toxin-antitoxin system RelE/ParE family toxin [Ruegeria sp.]MDA7964817.1 type II toxin-antitoxin system RelE/ParE family toxin [Ruegeria sp.]
MVYEVIRSDEIDRDFEQIFDFLFETALHFGEDVDTALQHAENRLVEIEDSLNRLGNLPHQGTLRPHLGSGIRNVTKDRAVIYFDVDDETRTIRVLAVFYSGQDHDARILLRLLS